MSSTSAIQSQTVNLTRIFIATNVSAAQVMMEMELTALKSKLIALKKTFAMFMLIAFSTQLCVEALAFVTRDMKAPAEVVSWLPNASHRLTADITRSATKEFVNVIEDMKETIRTCECLVGFKYLKKLWNLFLKSGASRLDHVTELIALRMLIVVTMREWRWTTATALKVISETVLLNANQFHHRVTSETTADFMHHAHQTTGNWKKFINFCSLKAKVSHLQNFVLWMRLQRRIHWRRFCLHHRSQLQQHARIVRPTGSMYVDIKRMEMCLQSR